MKNLKINSIIILSTLLISASSVSLLPTVSSASSIDDTKTETFYSLDDLFSKNTSGSTEINTSLSRIAMGGGNLKVTWGQDRHTVSYTHPKKTHLAIAKNRNSTMKSARVSKGNKAVTWIYSSLWGNTAGYDVK